MSFISLFSHFEFRLKFHLIVRNFPFWFSLNQFHSISCCHYRLSTTYKKVFSKKISFAPLMPLKPCFTGFLSPLDSTTQLEYFFIKVSFIYFCVCAFSIFHREMNQLFYKFSTYTYSWYPQPTSTTRTQNHIKSIIFFILFSIINFGKLSD